MTLDAIKTMTDDELAIAAALIQAEQDARYRATGGPPHATTADALAASDAEILATSRGEWRTQSIVRIADDYFHVDANGGERGAWQEQYGQHGPTTRTIDRTEARRLLLTMDLTPEDAARKTAR